MNNQRFAIDDLRAMVRFYSHMNESFNQSLSHEGLYKLWYYCTQSEKAYSELHECPDNWTEEQIQEALNWDGISGKRVI